MSRNDDQLYDFFMKPLEKIRLAQKRKELFDNVSGDVLEVGYGTGTNLKYYPYHQMDSITLLDRRSPDALRIDTIPETVSLALHEGDLTTLPFEDEQFDSIVSTLVFCTVSDPEQGMNELYRVLKPDGRLYFMEHILPCTQPYKKWFEILTPFWKKVAHGCHLNRDTVITIQHSGFELVEYHRFFRTSFVVGIGKKNAFSKIR
jgi:ubiquinone/menaquinone biosynthesis C-methylase UbiE